MPAVATLPTSMCSSVCPNNSANVTCGGPGNGELYNTSVVAADVQAFNARRPAGWQGESSDPQQVIANRQGASQTPPTM